MLRTGISQRHHTQGSHAQIGQCNAVWCPVRPRCLGADAKDRPARGQDHEAGLAAEELVAVSDGRCRTLVAAVRTIDIGGNCHLGGDARTIGSYSHGHCRDPVRRRQRKLANLHDIDSAVSRCAPARGHWRNRRAYFARYGGCPCLSLAALQPLRYSGRGMRRLRRLKGG